MIDHFYCQEKFNGVQIRMSDGSVSSCCQTTPHILRYNDIKDRSLAFFNYDSIVADRQKMLSGQKVEDCRSCWIPESRGLSSRRTRLNQTEKIYHNTFASPTHIDLNISNTCNQTCVYCDKYFSHSWLQDVIQNGPYDTNANDTRFRIVAKDRVINHISQKQQNTTGIFNELLRQVSEVAPTASISISGGEPFLNNNLLHIVRSISSAKQISIQTGLHVNTKRLADICAQLKTVAPDLKVRVSVENIGLRHEFLRFGSKWPTFLENLKIVEGLFDVHLRSTVCNATLFGLRDFLQFFQAYEINLYPLSDPVYLRPGVLDLESKKLIQQELCVDLHPDIPAILSHVASDQDIDQQHNLARFLREFARRRNLDMTIFPSSFLRWIEI